MSNVKPSISGKWLDKETWASLKAAGYTDEELYASHPFGPIIHSYTRAEAIEDGMLVDVSGTSEVREAGFKVPVAMTCAAYEATVAAGGQWVADPGDPEGGRALRLPGSQSVKGRLWDVMFLARLAAGTNPHADRFRFKVLVDAHGDGKAKPVKMWALVGPGDAGEPVITIMLEGED